MAPRFTVAERQQIAVTDRIKRKARQDAKRDRPKVDKGPTRDRDYKSWLHQGAPCLACQIEGPPAHTFPNPIEAAHIWLAEGAMKGLRNSDWTCIPLCRWHHQHAPDACDKAQRKFFDRLKLDPIDVVEAFNRAFAAGREAFWVVHELVAEWRGSVARREA